MSGTLQPRNVWRRAAVEAAGLLIDGDDYYRAVYEAGLTAQHSLLLAGWQFDSDACLLRGKEVEGAPLPVTLLAYLDALCQRAPDLRIYILAWDFHAVFALEREWMQTFKFNWGTSDRLTFMFDANHVDQGSHHQKFVVVDGQLAFLGGLDLCDHRWDDRSHKDPNPLRISRGEPHQPFHDVQAYVVSHGACAALTELFVTRWRAAGGQDLQLPPASPTTVGYQPVGAVPLDVEQVALSRTDPQGMPTRSEDCREICDLYQDAIAGAERLIYIETQYFSSREIGDGLARRLRTPGTRPLDVVVVLNMHAESLKEEVAVGLAQAKILQQLREAVVGTQHRLGLYYTVPHVDGHEEPARGTYIHSKIMIVDDRFLTIGSANLTNRSMGVDTELNLSVESEREGDTVARSIAAARRGLLCEHLGLDDVEGDSTDGLVTRLDERVARREGRLRPHPSPTEKEASMLQLVDPQQLPFDPAEGEYHRHEYSLFVGGLGALWKRLAPENRKG